MSQRDRQIIARFALRLREAMLNSFAVSRQV